MWSLQLAPRACAMRYLKGWFSIDLVSVIPFELFIAPQNGREVNINLVRLPRCLKLLRLPRLFRCGPECRSKIVQCLEVWRALVRFPSAAATDGTPPTSGTQR
jgi:hypothetical protein